MTKQRPITLHNQVILTGTKTNVQLHIALRVHDIIPYQYRQNMYSQVNLISQDNINM